MKRVLVLRPEPGATATVEHARRRGLDAVALPLFEIECVEWKVPAASDFDGLLLTSANALRCGGRQLQTLRSLPVYTVGNATAEAAREAGFGVADTGDAGVDRLLKSIDPKLSLLHLSGEDRRAPTTPKQAITSITVYRARLRYDLDLSSVDHCVALAHSPRAARRFAELVDKKSSITIAAISLEAAHAAGDGWAAVEAAAQPNECALLALTERLCNKAPAT